MGGAFRLISMRFPFIALLAALPAFVLHGGTFREVTTSELIDRCELIVAGTLDGTGTVKVTHRFKGDCPPVVQFSDLTDSDFKRVTGSCILLLKPGRDKFLLTHPGCFLRAKDEPHLREILHLKKDPGQFILQPDYPTNADAAHAIGVLFGRINAKGGPYAWLRESSWEYWGAIPWRDKIVVSVKGIPSPDGKPTLTISPDPAESQLAEYFHRYFLNAATPAHGITAPFWVEIDASVPKKFGTLPFRDAQNYLRRCLTSKDRQIVMEALLALGRMRDLDSLEFVRPLAEPQHIAYDYAKLFIEAATRHDNGLVYP